ncbi:MAG TPA: hypothetical protein VKS21_09745 [Spirochaetota bacterium]|nr:hypothetical protein [Spirochaetota bacterium]
MARILFLSTFLFLSSLSFAQTFGDKFTLIETGCRELALNGGGISFINNAEALNINPAAIALNKHKIINYGHKLYFFNMKMENFRLHFNLKEDLPLAFSEQFMVVHKKGINDYDDFGSINENSPCKYALVSVKSAAGYSFIKNKHFFISSGVTFHFYTEELNNKRFNNFNIQLGVLSSLKLTETIQPVLGKKINLGLRLDIFPLAVSPAVSVKWFELVLLEAGLRQIGFNSAGIQHGIMDLIYLAAQVTIKERLTLAAGLSGRNSGSFSFGLSLVTFELDRGDLILDWAMKIGGPVKRDMNFGFSYAF